MSSKKAIGSLAAPEEEVKVSELETCTKSRWLWKPAVIISGFGVAALLLNRFLK